MASIEAIKKYICGAINYPLISGQLANMVALHFDVPSEKAKEMTELALIEIVRQALAPPPDSSRLD